MSVLCPQCGAPAADGALKCEYCGATIQAAQPQQPVYQQPQQPVYQQPVYQPQVVVMNNERANWPIKNKIAAALLAILLGGIGAHHFYLGKAGKGLLYLLFCWTGIPAIIGFIEGILMLVSNDENFMIKHRCRLG